MCSLQPGKLRGGRVLGCLPSLHVDTGRTLLGWRDEERPTEAPPLSTLCLFSSLAEGGGAHDAEAPQGAEDVHDPDHRSVQVCLPSPHSVPPKLQTHLSPGPSSRKRDPAPSCSWGGTPRQPLCPPQGAGGWGPQDTGSLSMGAEIIHKHHVLFYMR